MTRWLLLLTLAACAVADAEGPRKAAGCFAYLDVQPNSLGVDSASTGELRGDEWSACATLDNDSTIAWESRDTTVFTIASTSDTTATVTGVGPGSAYAVATVGSHLDSSLVTVTGSTPAPPACAGAMKTFVVGDSVADTVAARPAGTSFCFPPGTFRMQSITPKTGDSFLSTGGTILSGARVLASFTVSGSTWYASGQTQGGTPAAGSPAQICKAATQRCLYAEDVFLDNVIQTHVTSLAAVSSGKWFFDYAADRIYIGTNPSGHTVETSVTAKAFQGSAANVTLRGLTVEKYANPYNTGAIHASGVGWKIDRDTTRWNHAAGVGTFGASDTVYGGKHSANGQYGITAYNASNNLVRKTLLLGNNIAGFSQSWAAGGGKWAQMTSFRLDSSTVSDNLGHGIWLDINNYLVVIRHNTAADNDGRGVFYEISYDAVIDSNTFSGNGSLATVLLRGGCVGVVSSPNVEVAHNTCDGDKDGITGVMDARGSGSRGLYDLTNLSVHHNTIQNVTAYAAGIVQTVGDNSYFTSKNNVWANNTYSGNPASPFYWQNAARNLTAWNGYGQQ